MTDKAQRTQWAEHLRDEAGAIAQQQVSAGSTHEPMEGPLPHTRNDTAAAAQDAVLAARQHCAAIAASFAKDAKLLQVLPDATPAQLRAAAVLALHIAESIRAGR
jgi:FPC/CPF motif-containing protein YcgG